MAEDINFLSGQSSLWVQPDGPNTKPLYLGCHGIGDVDEPLGDETMLYCPDESQTGLYKVKNSFPGEPGVVTTTVETDMRRIADYLEALGKCPATIFLHKVACGRRDVFTNFDRSFIFRYAKVTNRGIGNAASRQPGDENETTQSFDISARELSRVFNLECARETISSTEPITGLCIAGEERCESSCGSEQQPQDLIYAATGEQLGSVAATSEVLESVDEGAFAATAADPFGAGEDIQGIVCFRVGRDTVRVLVARGTTDAGNPAEVAYSDDAGVTWTAVDVGAINGEFVSNTHALFALSRYDIWLGTNLGNIYYSNDGGLTWTRQTDPAVSATPVHGISFYSPNTGFAVHTGGEVDKTTDGGDTWSAATASGCAGSLDIHAISAYFVWVVGTGGKYYTHDGGTTWSQRDAVATGAIDFLNETEGISVGSAASAVIYHTINGGYDWSPLPAITNAGFFDVHMVSSKLAYVCGAVSGGTGFIGKIVPVS